MPRLLRGEQRSSLHSTFPESGADEYERWAELVLGRLGMVATLERERGRLGEERRERDARRGQRREKRKGCAREKGQGWSSMEIKWFATFRDFNYEPEYVQLHCRRAGLYTEIQTLPSNVSGKSAAFSGSIILEPKARIHLNCLLKTLTHI